PGKAYNPLFLYGGVGLGKTHLVHAVGNHALKQNPNCHVVYLSSEAFTNDLIHALEQHKMPEFRARYREKCDILLLDDIQFLSNKKQTMEEFFHTFNALHEGGKQIFVTSDKLPTEIEGFEERLRSRFQWGLTADIQPPEGETRVATLKKEAKTDNIARARQVAMYLTRKITALSYPVIGEKFGGKDHSTVINAEQRIEQLMGEDPELARVVESIQRRLNS